MRVGWPTLHAGMLWHKGGMEKTGDAGSTVHTSPRLFVVREVAAMLRVCPETIKRRLRVGEIAGIWAGWGWRVSAAEVERLMVQGLARPPR